MENKTLSEQARALRKNYMRKWRQAHPEKDREYHVRYWNKKASELTQEEREALAAEELEAMREALAPGFELEIPNFDFDNLFD